MEIFILLIACLIQFSRVHVIDGHFSSTYLITYLKVESICDAEKSQLRQNVKENSIKYPLYLIDLTILVNMYYVYNLKYGNELPLLFCAQVQDDSQYSLSNLLPPILASIVCPPQTHVM